MFLVRIKRNTGIPGSLGSIKIHVDDEQVATIKQNQNIEVELPTAEAKIAVSQAGGWSKDKELTQLKSSLDTIQKTSHELISNIEKELLLLQRNRENNLKISLYDGEIDIDRIKEDNIEKPGLVKKIEEVKERAKGINRNIEPKPEIAKEIER